MCLQLPQMTRQSRQLFRDKMSSGLLSEMWLESCLHPVLLAYPLRPYSCINNRLGRRVARQCREYYAK